MRVIHVEGGPQLTPTHTDYETDTVIQTSLRKELKKDTTLLIVAHRLQTIMDADKIVRHFFMTHSVLTHKSVIHLRWYWMPDGLYVSSIHLPNSDLLIP